MALFDIAACAPLRVEQIDVQGFLKPIESDDEPFLSLQDGDALSAIFLGGEWRFHSSPVAQLSNRRGFFIPDVSIRVDLESMIIDEGAVGVIVRSPGVYGVRTHRAGNGLTQRVIVPIDGVAPQFAPDAVRVAFPKWEIGRVVGDSWFKLLEVDATPPPA